MDEELKLFRDKSYLNSFSQEYQQFVDQMKFWKENNEQQSRQQEERNHQKFNKIYLLDDQLNYPFEVCQIQDITKLEKILKFKSETYLENQINGLIRIIIQIFFWIIVVIKIPDRVLQPKNIYELLSSMFYDSYSKFFKILQPPIDQSVNAFIKQIGLITLKEFQKNFPDEYQYFQDRLQLDIYHVLFQLTHGTYVTDSFLRQFQQQKLKKSLSHLQIKKRTSLLQNNHLNESSVLQVHKQQAHIIISQKDSQHSEQQKQKINQRKYSDKESVINKTNRISHKMQTQGQSLSMLKVNQFQNDFKAILKTKKQKQEKIIFKTNTVKPDFPESIQSKFNCNHVSPFIGNEHIITQRDKIVQHSVKSIPINNMNSLFQKELEIKKPQIRTNSQSSLLQKYNIPQLIYSKNAEQLPKYFKNMNELEAVLNHHKFKLTDLDFYKNIMLKNPIQNDKQH